MNPIILWIGRIVGAIVALWCLYRLFPRIYRYFRPEKKPMSQPIIYKTNSDQAVEKLSELLKKIELDDDCRDTKCYEIAIKKTIRYLQSGHIFDRHLRTFYFPGEMRDAIKELNHPLMKKVFLDDVIAELKREDGVI